MCFTDHHCVAVAAIQQRHSRHKLLNPILWLWQDLEDKVSGHALDTARTDLATAHEQVAQLQSQLHEAQARCSSMTQAEAQVRQLRSELQQQQATAQEQSTAVAALTGGFDQECASWQAERNSLLARAKV